MAQCYHGIPWYHGTWYHGTMAPVYPGTMVAWCRYHGTVVPWYHGTMVHGTMVPWYHGTMLPCYHGTMEPWYHGTMVPWYHGTMVPVQPGTWFVINLVQVHVWFTVHGGSLRRGSGSCRFGSDGRLSWFRFPVGSVSGSRVNSQASCNIFCD